MLRILHKLRDWWNPRQKATQGPRRVKAYAAQTGFQYQYQLEDSLPGDYRFVIWSAGGGRREMRIRVPLMELAARDRYALAKLRLFQAFDELAPGELPRELEVTDTEALDALG